jgi:hypothetical protein
MAGAVLDGLLGGFYGLGKGIFWGFIRHFFFSPSSTLSTLF